MATKKKAKVTSFSATEEEEGVPKRGRGRPPRGEGTTVLHAKVGTAREGVRVAESERRDLERAAKKEGVSLSALLRRVALVFARDPNAAAQVRGSTAWA